MKEKQEGVLPGYGEEKTTTKMKGIFLAELANYYCSLSPNFRNIIAVCCH